MQELMENVTRTIEILRRNPDKNAEIEEKGRSMQ